MSNAHSLSQLPLSQTCSLSANGDGVIDADELSVYINQQHPVVATELHQFRIWCIEQGAHSVLPQTTNDESAAMSGVDKLAADSCTDKESMCLVAVDHGCPSSQRVARS